MAFQKAVRTQVKVRVGLIGPSGAGKTYSALRMATGMAKAIGEQTGTPGKILFLDTEARRGLIYADEFDYFYEELQAPYSPDLFLAKLKDAEAEGMDIVILDSTSHEWQYLLAKVSELKKSGRFKNEFSVWDQVTPLHDKFIDGILRSKCHIIANMRGKDQYVMEEKDGKQKPKKLGVGPQMRDGFEYEFHVSLLIDQVSHIATVAKDNTKRWEDKKNNVCEDMITEEDGAYLIRWANEGEAIPVPAPKPAAAPAAQAAVPPKQNGGRFTEQGKANPQAKPSEKELLESANNADIIVREIQSAISPAHLAAIWRTYSKTIANLVEPYQGRIVSAKDAMKQALAMLLPEGGAIVQVEAGVSKALAEGIREQICEAFSVENLVGVWKKNLAVVWSLSVTDQIMLADECDRMNAEFAREEKEHAAQQAAASETKATSVDNGEAVGIFDTKGTEKANGGPKGKRSAKKAEVARG